MANSDKNIVIVPNKDQTEQPKITFTGFDNDPITLRILDDNALSFEGSEGQLLGISNNLSSGTIFSVNDISGIPSIEVDADGTISLAEFNGSVGIGTAAPSQLLDVEGTIEAHALTRPSGNLTLSTTTSGDIVMVPASGIAAVDVDHNNQTSLGARNDSAGSNATAALFAKVDGTRTAYITNYSASYTAVPYFAGKAVAGTNGMSEWLFFGEGASGKVSFFTGIAQASDERLSVSQAQTVVNEPGNDHDFRVEGSTEPNLFFVDASADRVGIGTNAPVQTLHVGGSAAFGISANSTNSNRTFNLIDESATVKVQRYTGDTLSDPAVELIWGTDDSPASTTNYRWDFFVSAGNSSLADSFNIRRRTGNVNAVKATFTASETIFNDSGDDVDFRVEGSTDPNLLFVDASANTVVAGHNSGLINAGAVDTNFKFQVLGGGLTLGAFATFSNNAGDHSGLYLARGRGTVDAPLITSSGDTIGALRFARYATSANGPALNTSSRIVAVANDNGASGQSGADLVIETIPTGTQTLIERAAFNSSEVVFNDPGNNYDFRVEGDTDPNLLFADASTDRVGIGTSAPITLLHISSDGLAPAASFVTSDEVTISKQNNAAGFIGSIASSNDVAHRMVFKGVRARGTLASPSAPIADDYVLSLLGSIHDGSVTQGTAQVNFIVDGAVSSGVAPQRISFETSPTNALGRVERLTIYSDGAVVVNETGADADFRVEGDTDPNLLFVDASVDHVGVGTGSPLSKFHVDGSVAAGVDAISATTTLDSSHHTAFVTTGSNTITLTLPAASTAPGRRYEIKKVDSDSGTVSIVRSGSDLIDGQTAQTLTVQYESVSLVSDGVSSWFIV